MLWWIYKHKHSISNVFIFRIISFNDFWKCLRLRVSTWNFLAVYFIAFLVGFVGNPRVFLSLLFASIRSACSLEILSTQNPPQLLPPWNCRSSQKFTDLNWHTGSCLSRSQHWNNEMLRCNSMTGRQSKGKLRKSGSILWWSLVNCMRWPMGHQHFFYFRCDLQNAELFPTTLPPLPPTHTVVLLFFQICSWETSEGSFYGGNNFKTMFETKQLLNKVKFWCKWGIRLVWWLATCTNRSHNQWSFKQWVGILLMTKIDRVCKNYLTPKIWEEMHLRETIYGTLIFQQSSMICIGRHVGGHTPALQHGGQNYFLLVSC